MTPFRSLQGILLLLLLGIDADCAYPPRIPLEVEYAGCRDVLLPGPYCVLREERKLSLWIGAPPEARIEIRTGGQRIDVVGKPVQGGQQFSLTLPQAAAKVGVLVETAKGRASWSLGLAEAAGEASRNILRQVDKTLRLVDKMIKERRLAEAREMLHAVRIHPKAPAESRCQLSYYKGLLAEKEGDYRTALTEVQDFVKTAERLRLDNFQWLAEEKLAMLLCGVGRFREAAQLFDRLGRISHSTNSCQEAQLFSNQAWSALLAREAGESLGDPAPLLEKALETYDTCESVTPEEKANILINLALAHLQEGRLAQAKDQLSRAYELEPHPSIPHQLWQLDLEARIARREGRPEEALYLFAGLHELALVTSSADGRLRATLGEARSREALGDRTGALETLQEAETLLDEQSLQIPLHAGREFFMATRQAVVSLHIELLLKQRQEAEALTVARHGRSRMIRQLERGDSLANLASEQRTRWESLLAEYQERRAALEERVKGGWKLPLDQRRQERATRKAEAEAIQEILDQAFLLLNNPGEQRRKEPPPPRPGELILAYHPLPRGWVGFAADGKSVRVHRFELPLDLSRSQPEQLARHLLLPFRTSIEKAQRIRILASGPLRDVDFHALPFGGDILLASRPVVYGLDLPVSTGSIQTASRHALLVADPRDDLPGALTEARKVGQALKAGLRPWTTEELKSAEASLEAVQGRFATADLLHYAGHGTFSGLGGWESGLLLAEETQLALGDILALERVPAWVVLSGCDTGRSSAETPVESLGLAHAFLLAGSQAVVASTRPADDREVPAFFTDLYREWDREPDLTVAFQRAQLSWRQRRPKADWRGFRLFVP